MATHFRGTSPGSVRVSDATSQTVRSIGIFGHYANTNLGDEAIIEAVLTNLRQRLPHATFYAFSRDPVDSEKRYGVPAFSIGRGFVVVRSELDENLRPAAPVPDPTERDDGGGPSVRELLKRIPGLRPAVLLSRMLVTGLRNAGPELRCCWASARVLRNVDLLIVTGSNQFLDNFGGSAAYPFTLLKWAVLCWLTGTKLCFASVGAGPLDAKLSKFLVRLALLFSSYTSFRDENSMKLIHALGARKSTLVFPDLAHSLAVDFPADRPRAARIDGQKPTIAINPMPMYDSRYWCEPDDSRYLDYVDELAKASSQLLRDGYPLFFFGTQSMDENVIADVVERLDADVAEDFDVARQFKRSQTVQELMAIITSADIVVPTRFHGTVLSLHAARGVVAICYYRKTHDIMREMGQGAYALDFDGLCADQLVERVKHLEANLDDATRVIRERDDAYQRALDQQYANLVELAQRG